MGKQGKQKRAATRKEAKKNRKLANYLRTGPKAGSKLKKKKYGTHKSRATKPEVNPSPTPPSVTGRRRRRKLAAPAPNKGHTKLAKRPLRPLRKRRHLGSAR